MDNFEKSLNTALEKLVALDCLRERQIVDLPCQRLLYVDGKPLLNFASNDYLGLAAHPLPAAAFSEAASVWGSGSGASPLISGHFSVHEALEKALAAHVGFPSALSFSSGYLANLAVIPTLADRGSAVFSDRLNHASLIDAMQLAKAQGATVKRYAHNDLTQLAYLLKNTPAKRKIIATDAVFSMDGDMALLPDLLLLAIAHDAWLLVDDAHGFGVLGEKGRGSLAHFQMDYHPRLILMATLGKAVGVAGAFVAGSELLTRYLLQKARSYIFSTAAPPAISAAALAALPLLAAGDDLRERLSTHRARLASGLRGLPWTLLASITAIQPLVIGDNAASIALSRALKSKGLWVPAIRPPTVPEGSARLRISLSAAQTEEDLDQLIQALRHQATKYRKIK